MGDVSARQFIFLVVSCSMFFSLLLNELKEVICLSIWPRSIWILKHFISSHKISLEVKLAMQMKS